MARPDDNTHSGASPRPRARLGGRGLGALALLALALAIAAVAIGPRLLGPRRATPVLDPPVLAGQHLWASCSGGVYARRGGAVVLTSSGHCAAEGQVAVTPAGVTLGVFGPPARDAVCPHPGHTCAASDINSLVVAPDRVPWGRLNLVDMGAGGYRSVAPGTRALTCAEIGMGDEVEINGRDLYRAGRVLEKGENLKDPALDGSYFPCMIAADIAVATGDSGGVVLVRGVPAGVVSRSFVGYLGFTPLAEGLAALGLEMCDAPDCGLTPPAR